MFDGLREEVDKARWKHQCKRWRKEAAVILAVRPKDVQSAYAADSVGDVLVVHFYPETPSVELWCVGVDTLFGTTFGDPIRLIPPPGYAEMRGLFAARHELFGQWISHVRGRAWEQEWGLDWAVNYRKIRAATLARDYAASIEGSK